MKKLLTLLFASVVAIPLAMVVFAQEAPTQAKQARWEGNIIRSDKDQSTLTVRKVGSTLERTVMYDSSTKWVSQYHGDTKVNDITRDQVKDGDRVICTGTWDKDKPSVLHATVISLRLSHSPQ
jgi:hypothetical protein